MGVKSSSHISTPMQVSGVETTASPKGTVVCHSDQLPVHPSRIREGRTDLSGDVGNNTREPVLLRAAVLDPGREPAQLAVVAVVGHPHLWSDEENATVVDEDAAVVDYILVRDGPAWRKGFSLTFSTGELRVGTDIPTSTRIPCASSDSRILMRTSHAWRCVSPGHASRRSGRVSSKAKPNRLVWL